MGEYFKWANPVKKEKLICDAFDDCGFMLSCSSYTTTLTTRAAETLLAGPWKGDPVIYLGDYFDFDKAWKANNPSPVPYFDTTHPEYDLHFDGNPYEIVMNCYKDVGGRFIESKGREYTEYWDGDQWEDMVYGGPFDLRIRDYKYALNLELFEYVDLGMTWEEYSKNEGYITDDALIDPLPKLLCARPFPGELTGRWAGYAIETTNDLPDSRFTLLDWRNCGA